MRKGAAPGTVPPDPSAPPPRWRGRWLPFWLLQVVELVVAFIFVDISVHVSNSGLMVAAAIAFVALAVTAHGPLGLVRICRPWLHLTLVISVAAVVAVAPLVPALRPDIEGIIVVEFGAIGLIRLATLTDMNPSARSRRQATSRRNDPMVIEATATVTQDASARSSAPGGPRTTSPSPGGAAARWAGRAAGAASASGRRTVAKHRPEAEKQVRRAIRGAGRLTGRVTSPAERHPPGAQPPDTPGDTTGG